MENLLITLEGKGRKQRIVPYSFGLRRALHRFVTDFNRKPDSLLLATQQNTRVNRIPIRPYVLSGICYVLAKQALSHIGNSLRES